MMEDGKKKVIFLDRDGTINVDSGYVHKIKDWVFVEGALEALRLLQEAGYVLSVVTNQSGIDQGLYTLKDMERVHDHMLAELEKSGIDIKYIAFCSHGRDNSCECRKPKLGMIKALEKQIGQIDFVNSWTIGDKLLDFELGKNASTKTALIRSKYWGDDELKDGKPDLIVKSLYEAVHAIIDK